ncbi:MAG: hypothetical protein R3Y07_05945 [Eubacteriales bacterium]
MKRKKIHMFGFSALLLTGIIFVYHETTTPDGLFYQSSTTGTSTVVSTTTQTGSSREVALLFELERDITAAVFDEFSVEVVVGMMELEGRLCVSIALIITTLETLELEDRIQEFVSSMLSEWDDVTIDINFGVDMSAADDLAKELDAVLLADADLRDAIAARQDKDGKTDVNSELWQQPTDYDDYTKNVLSIWSLLNATIGTDSTETPKEEEAN